MDDSFLLLIAGVSTAALAVTVLLGHDLDLGSDLLPLPAVFSAVSVTALVAYAVSPFAGFAVALMMGVVVGCVTWFGVWRLLRFLESSSDTHTDALRTLTPGEVAVVQVGMSPQQMGKVRVSVDGVPLMLSAVSDDVCESGDEVLVLEAVSGTCVRVKKI